MTNTITMTVELMLERLKENHKVQVPERFGKQTMGWNVKQSGNIFPKYWHYSVGGHKRVAAITFDPDWKVFNLIRIK